MISKHHIGALLAILAPAIPSGNARAQDILDQKSAAEIRTRYLADLDTVHVKIVALAEAIPDSSFKWRPVAGTRSVAEALMHVASEWYFYGPISVGGQPPADFGPPRETLPKLEKVATKAEVLEHLRKSWAYCKGQVETADVSKLTGRMKLFGQEVTLVEVVLLMTGDLHEHLGQLVTYARSVGVVPPWSRKS